MTLESGGMKVYSPATSHFLHHLAWEGGDKGKAKGQVTNPETAQL